MQESLFNEAASLKAGALLKEAPTEVFSCDICENFKNTFFYRALPVAASGNGKTFHRLSIFYYHILAKCSVFN